MLCPTFGFPATVTYRDPLAHGVSRQEKNKDHYHCTDQAMFEYDFCKTSDEVMLKSFFPGLKIAVDGYIFHTGS